MYGLKQQRIATIKPNDLIVIDRIGKKIFFLISEDAHVRKSEDGSFVREVYFLFLFRHHENESFLKFMTN